MEATYDNPGNIKHYSSSSNATQLTVIEPPPPQLIIMAGTDKQYYAEGEQVVLNVSTTSGSTVTYKVKDSSSVVIKSGLAPETIENSGTYIETFNAPLIPGTNNIEITASKVGFQDGYSAVTFVVDDTIPPTPPRLLSPFNNSSLNNSKPSMEWSDSIDIGSDVAEYKIEIDDNIDFSSPFVNANITTSSYSVPNNLPDNTYYWRVEAKDNSNNWSSSDIWKFTIDTVNPTVDITSPTSESTFPTSQPTIDIEGTTSKNVTLVMWDSNKGSSGFASLSNSTSSWSLSGINLEPGDNLITVTARDAAGNTGTDTLMVTYENKLSIVWQDDSPGNNEIYFKMSKNGGIDWTKDIRLTNNVGSSEYPSIAVDGQNIYVVWQNDSPSSGAPEIYFKKSTNGGVGWPKATRLTQNAGYSEYPSIAVDGQNIYVVWQDDTLGNNEIYYSYSENGGTTWTEPENLTNNESESVRPRIAISR